MNRAELAIAAANLCDVRQRGRWRFEHEFERKDHVEIDNLVIRIRLESCVAKMVQCNIDDDKKKC